MSSTSPLDQYLSGDRSPQIIYSIAESFLRSSQPQNAILCLTSSESSSISAKGQFLLGRSYLQLLEPSLASIHLNNAVALAPSNAAAWHALGLAHLDLFNTETAIDILEKATNLEPRFADIHNTLAVAYKYLGQFDRARRSFDRAISIEPTMYSAHRNKSLITDYTSDKEHFSGIEALYTSLSTTDLNVAVQIGFAYSRALEQLNKYNQAMDVLVHANNSRLLQIRRFSSSKENHHYNNLLRSDTKSSCINSVSSKLPPGHTKPIFIVGMPRSGTSLLETILSNDDSIVSCDELTFLERSIGRYCSTQIPGALAINDSSLAAVRGYYYHLLYQSRPEIFGSYAYHVDKMPCNFRFVNVILKAFPGARVIHCTRSPLDNLLSMYREFFSSGLEYSYDLNDSLSFFLLQHKLMSQWKQRYPSQIFECSYENLVSQPSQVVISLCSFLKIQYSDELLCTDRSSRSVRTASSVTSRSAISSKSIGSWRRYEKLFLPLIPRLQSEGFEVD